MFVQRSQQSTQGTHFPAPTQGIDSRQALSAMEIGSCIYAYNIMPKDFGMKVREGTVEWANNTLGGITPKTIMPYTGSLEDGSADRLYYADDKGIWDVTQRGTTAPPQVVVWPSQVSPAGACTFVQYVNDDSASWFLVCDQENGYYTYEQATDTWAAVTTAAVSPAGLNEVFFDDGNGVAVPGLAATDLVYVLVWKRSIWFIEKNSARAWVLPIGQIFGDLTEFQFGNKHEHGGYVECLFNWSLDGGDGIDDYLVAVGSAGDVSVWQGTNIVTDISIVGTWFIGEVPKGRRLGVEYGGDLFILSTFGLISMSSLLNGASTTDLNSYLTNKIAPYLREILTDYKNDFGWQVDVYPRLGLLIIGTPVQFGKARVQLVFNFATNAWGIWRDLPVDHFHVWQDRLIFVAFVNDVPRVYITAGNVDDVRLSDDPPPKSIDWSMLSAYQSFDSPATFKRVQFLRPVFVSGASPSYGIEARYDFQLFEVDAQPALAQTIEGLWGDAGTYIFTLRSNGADVMELGFGDGNQQAGVTTIDVTIGTHPLATLTWNGTTGLYEGASVGVQAYLVSEIGNALATTINPDSLASGAYTLTPGAIGLDAGYQPPQFSDPDLDPQTPLVETLFGSISPTVLNGTVGILGGLWDDAVWGGGVRVAQVPTGAWGMGRYVAYSLRGTSADEVTLVGVDVLFDTGGLL